MSSLVILGLYSVGVVGATVRPGGNCICDHVHEARSLNPSVMYLHICENDFRSSHDDACRAMLNTSGAIAGSFD